MSTDELTGIDAMKSAIKSMAALARHLGVERSSVQKWKKVPAERLGEVSRFTGLSPQVLRPDLFEGVGQAS